MLKFCSDSWYGKAIDIGEDIQKILYNLYKQWWNILGTSLAMTVVSELNIEAFSEALYKWD